MMDTSEHAPVGLDVASVQGDAHAPAEVSPQAPVITAGPQIAPDSAAETVTVMCYLPHGLRIVLPRGSGVYIEDDQRVGRNAEAADVITLAGSNAGSRTAGVPAAAMRQWLAEHADFEPVAQGFISIEG
jgi:hypothetical protein